jgi:hypothetical protein
MPWTRTDRAEAGSIRAVTSSNASSSPPATRRRACGGGTHRASSSATATTPRVSPRPASQRSCSPAPGRAERESGRHRCDSHSTTRGRSTTIPCTSRATGSTGSRSSRSYAAPTAPSSCPSSTGTALRQTTWAAHPRSRSRCGLPAGGISHSMARLRRHLPSSGRWFEAYLQRFSTMARTSSSRPGDRPSSSSPTRALASPASSARRVVGGAPSAPQALPLPEQGALEGALTC